jgi:DNA-binding PadR family transcriptional regulator
VTRTLSPQTVTVLTALAANPSAWRHGYELGREVGLKAGSLYPILMRLRDRGLLEATWETDPPPGRPARHLYRLTGDGAVVAAQHAAVEVRETRRHDEVRGTPQRGVVGGTGRLGETAAAPTFRAAVGGGPELRGAW